MPPVVLLGISPDAASEDGYKDTERNIRDTGEFVVNLVDDALAERMNVCAVDFPAGIGALDKAQSTPLHSVGLRPPRIAQSPVSFDASALPASRSARARCSKSAGSFMSIFATTSSIPPRCKMHVRAEKLRLIGRMHGRGCTLGPAICS